jgi:hypothetical protein
MKIRLVALFVTAVAVSSLPLSAQESKAITAKVDDTESPPSIPRRLLTQDEIRRFVAQLGSPSEAKQKEARRILIATGRAAVKELFLAQSSDDEALAARAKAALTAIPESKFRLQNAAGDPVDHCRIEFFDMVPFSTQLADVPFARGSTDSGGGVALPALPPQGAVAFRVTHQRFGTTVTRFSESETAMLARQQNSSFRRIWLPVVPRTFAHISRAVEGVVRDEFGEPIPGAEVHCRYIRTNGGNGISGITPLSCVVTGRTGRFRLYLPSLQRSETGDFRMQLLRQDPLPENSEYQLVVRVPGDLTYCPVELWQSNTKPAVITLRRTHMPRRFRFESIAGGFVTKKQDLAKITLRHQPLDPAEGDQWPEIDRRIIVSGGPVHTGRYWASFETDEGTRVSWQNLIVTDDSPEELTFRLPPPVIYRGRVVDPVTSKPLAGIFVGGYRSVTQKTLASITDKEWSAAEKLPPDPPITAEALTPFLQVNGFRQIVRTSKDGRFELHQPPDFRFYGVAAFARNRLPIWDRVFPETAGSKIPDLPLFPAAKIKVRPVPPSAAEQQAARRFHGPSRVANRVTLFWSFPKEGQPAWTSVFRKLVKERVHCTVGRPYHSIPVNRTTDRYVPAELPIRLEFHSGDNAAWIPRSPDPLKLSLGEISDLGALTFAPAIAVQVRAVGPKGDPVAGVSIRRLISRGEEQVWAIGQETDTSGLALFNVPQNASVSFQASPELLSPRGKYFAVRLDAKTAEFPPREPFQIRLTDEQIRILFNRPDKPE